MPFPSGGRPTGSGPPAPVAPESFPSARVARMKTTQWIAALVALVIVVFLSTFAINFLGTSSKPSEQTTTTVEADLATLEFPIKSFPHFDQAAGLVYGRFECEHRKPGHQDYLFTNPNDQAV